MKVQSWMALGGLAALLALAAPGLALAKGGPAGPGGLAKIVDTLTQEMTSVLSTQSNQSAAISALQQQQHADQQTIQNLTSQLQNDEQRIASLESQQTADVGSIQALTTQQGQDVTSIHQLVQTIGQIGPQSVTVNIVDEAGNAVPIPYELMSTSGVAYSLPSYKGTLIGNTVKNVPQGVYTVEALSPDYQFYSDPTVTVTGLAPVNVTMTLDGDTYTVSGTITGLSGTAVRPVLEDASGNVVGILSALGQDGSFSISGVPSGTYYLYTPGLGSGSALGSVTVTSQDVSMGSMAETWNLQQQSNP